MLQGQGFSSVALFPQPLPLEEACPNRDMVVPHCLPPSERWSVVRPRVDTKDPSRPGGRTGSQEGTAGQACQAHRPRTQKLVLKSSFILRHPTSTKDTHHSDIYLLSCVYIYIHIHIHARMHDMYVHVHMLRCACGARKTTWLGWFSPSTFCGFWKSNSQVGRFVWRMSLPTEPPGHPPAVVFI